MNGQVEFLMNEKVPSWNRMHEEGGSECIYEILSRPLKLVLRERYWRRGRRDLYGDPCVAFRRKHGGHPRPPQLIMAHEVDSVSVDFRRLVWRISRDGWRPFLVATHPSDIDKIHRFVQKEGSRPSNQFKCSCADAQRRNARFWPITLRCACAPGR